MAQKIPEEIIEQIRSKTDIVDVIGEYVQLTKRGRNYFGLCPFHGEQTPSFSVSTDKQIFHCFGCGAGGSAITFLMDIDNISFQEATAKLGERVGIHVDVSSTPNIHTHPISPEEGRMKDAHSFAADYYPSRNSFAGSIWQSKMPTPFICWATCSIFGLNTVPPCKKVFAAHWAKWPNWQMQASKCTILRATTMCGRLAIWKTKSG